MKPLKFRVYDFKLNKMIYSEEYKGGLEFYFKAYPYDLFDHAPSKEYSEHMQFTGLEDINDKEIYEGDILIFKIIGAVLFEGYERATYNFHYEVIYDSETTMFSVCQLYRHGYHFEHLYHLQEEHGLKVCGNVYENPELKETIE